jgi:hypothetical protein
MTENNKYYRPKTKEKKLINFVETGLSELLLTQMYERAGKS